MDINNLAPWNWFKGEEEKSGSMAPSKRGESSEQYPAPEGQSPIIQLQRKMNQLFDTTFRGFGLPSFGFEMPSLAHFARSGPIRPQVNISANDKTYEITVEIPGVDKKDVRLEITNNTMIISGEKQQEKEEKDKSYYRMERSYGAFRRVLSLPEDATQEAVKARFKNGVLTVTLARKALPKSAVRQIEIKSS
jgi:HSP20 family protein